MSKEPTLGKITDMGEFLHGPGGPPAERPPEPAGSSMTTTAAEIDRMADRIRVTMKPYLRPDQLEWLSTQLGELVWRAAAGVAERRDPPDYERGFDDGRRWAHEVITDDPLVEHAQKYLLDFIAYEPGTTMRPQREKAEAFVGFLVRGALRAGGPANAEWLQRKLAMADDSECTVGGGELPSPLVCDRCGLPGADRHVGTFNFHTSCPGGGPAREEPSELLVAMAGMLAMFGGHDALDHDTDAAAKKCDKCRVLADARNAYGDAALSSGLPAPEGKE